MHVLNVLAAAIGWTCIGSALLVVCLLLRYRPTPRPRKTVDHADAWKADEYDTATRSHLSPRGIAPHGLGPKCDRASHSPVVPVAYFDESARRALREISTEHHEEEA